MGLDFIPTAIPAALPSNGAVQQYASALQNRLVAKPKGVDGIDGFVFDYAGEVRVDHDADITDHFTENNLVINDHIGIKPIRVALRGLVGELVQTRAAAAGIFGLLGSLPQVLTTVPAYLGAYTPGGFAKIQGAISQAQNIENQLNKAVSQGKSIANFFGAPTQTRQQAAYARLETSFNTRRVFDLLTPYKLYRDMVIQSVSFIQPEETKMVSEVTVMLKQLRFAQILTSPNDGSKFSGRAATMNQALKKVGNPPGVRVGASILANAVNAVTGLFHK